MTENYAVFAQTWVNGTMEVEFFRSYKYQAMVSLLPFTITPYAQAIWYEYNGAFSMGVSGWRDVRIGDVVTTITTNALICE